MIWYENIWAFLDYNKLGCFFPSAEMNTDEQMNCIMRFTIYFVISLLVLTRNINYLYLLVFVAFITAMIHKVDNATKVQESELYEKLNISKNNGYDKHTYKPSSNNPFMNVMAGDYKQFPNRPPASSWNDKTTRDNVNSKFENGLVRDVNDLYNKNASDRQYYTMPSTTIPNNQETFAKWLYHNPNKTYKEPQAQYFYVQKE